MIHFSPSAIALSRWASKDEALRLAAPKRSTRLVSETSKVEKNEEEAVRWYRRAADGGDSYGNEAPAALVHASEMAHGHRIEGRREE
jgi:TPR repeat protein